MVDEFSGPMTVEEMYGDWDWEAAMEVLDRSLNPRQSSALFDIVGSLGVSANHTVLDIGGRDGAHALLMAERFGCRAVSVDPVEANVSRGREMVAEHDFGHLVELRLGAIEHIPAADASFDFILSRDMMGHIADTDAALADCARVLRPNGAMAIHEVFATPLLEPLEARLICDYTATVLERLSVSTFESAVARAAFTVEQLDLIGSEWVEANQEAGTVPNYLLQISRLRRAKDHLVEELGDVPYRVIYGNALWSIYRLIGKLETRVYVLRREAQATP